MKRLNSPQGPTRGNTKVVISRASHSTDAVVRKIADSLAKIGIIKVVRVTPGFIQASSETHGPRKHPVTKPGHPTAIGVSLIVDVERREIQFYEITSALKGCGSRMVEAVLNALPKTWSVFVLMDWSDGFWKVMRRRHRRIVLL